MPKFNPHLAFEKPKTQDEWQGKALRKTLEYCAENSPFYKELLKQHKVDINNIKGLKDISFLPTTTKGDMQKDNWKFLCVETNKVKEYTTTSGTLGKPVTIALTAKDLKRLAYN